MNHLRKLLGRVKRKLTGKVLPVYDLLEVCVILQGDKVKKLHFAKETRIETIRQSISLLSDAWPLHVQLLNADRLLDDEQIVAELNPGVEGRIEITVIISRFKNTEGMFWKNENLNPFPDQILSDFALERATWFYQQDEQDSAVRRILLKDLICNMNLEGMAIVIMAFNAGFSSMFINWVRSCDLHKIAIRKRAIIFPMDEESKKLAETEGFNVCYDENSTILSSIGNSKAYGDSEFNKHMFFQNAIIRDMLTMDCEFLFQDVDLVWLEDPFEYFSSHAEYDIEFMFDGRTSRHGPLCANTGFIYFRPSRSTISFWEVIYQNYDRVIQYCSQQQPLNRYLGVLQNRGLKVNILPQELFANGHLFGPEQEKSNLPEKPKVIHCSWTANMKNKIIKYKNNDLWFICDDL